MLKRCGLFFIFLALSGHAFCAQNQSLDLEPIVILRPKSYFLNSFSLKAKDFSASPVESLRNLPIDLQSRSPAKGIQTDFSLRGSNFQGVLFLLNGQRINDPQTGHHNADFPFTQADIEKIDLIPGLSSSLFGPDAIGGAINFLTKKPQDRQAVLEGSYGAFNTKSGLVSFTERIKDLRFRVSSEYAKSDGFRYDTDFKKYTATFSSSLDAPYGAFNLNFGYQDKEFGAFDFYTPGSGFPSREWTKTYLLDTGLLSENEGVMIKPNFLWRRHYDRFMLDETGVRSRYLNQHRTDMYTPNIYFQKQIGLLGRAGLGIEYGREEIHSTNLGKHLRNHESVFLDGTNDINSRLSLSGSLRIDNFDGFDTAYTGSLNFRYRIQESQALALSISRSMRIPTFTELYYNDPTTVGDPGLSDEKAANFQLGYDYKRGGLSFGAVLFFREEKDTIDWIKRSAADPKWQAQNITEAQVCGLESYFKYEINKYVNLSSNYAYINKNVADGGYLYKYGQNYSRHLANIMVNFNLPCGTQGLALTYKQKPSRSGWFLLNSHFSCNIAKHAGIFLGITNVLDVKYEEIAGIPQPGRSFEGGVRFEW